MLKIIFVTYTGGCAQSLYQLPLTSSAVINLCPEETTQFWEKEKKSWTQTRSGALNEGLSRGQGYFGST